MDLVFGSAPRILMQNAWLAPKINKTLLLRSDNMYLFHSGRGESGMSQTQKNSSEKYNLRWSRAISEYFHGFTVGSMVDGRAKSENCFLGGDGGNGGASELRGHRTSLESNNNIDIRIPFHSTIGVCHSSVCDWASVAVWLWATHSHQNSSHTRAKQTKLSWADHEWPWTFDSLSSF